MNVRHANKGTAARTKRRENVIFSSVCWARRKHVLLCVTFYLLLALALPAARSFGLSICSARRNGTAFGSLQQQYLLPALLLCGSAGTLGPCIMQ